MNAETEAEATAIALLTAAGLDDEAAIFSAVLDDIAPELMRDLVVELVAVWRGTVRGLAKRNGEDGTELVDIILRDLGGFTAAKS